MSYEPTECYFCKLPVTPHGSLMLDRAVRIFCKTCGEYEVTYNAAVKLKGIELTPRQAANARGWLYERFGRTEERVVLDVQDVDRLLALRTPSVGEKAFKLLRAIATLHPDPGEHFAEGCATPSDLAVAWLATRQEYDYIIDTYLTKTAGYLAGESMGTGDGWFGQISPRGWQYLDEQSTAAEGNTGFVAMWFHPTMQQTYNDAFAPAILAAKYEPKMMLVHEHNRDINDEILALIRRSKFVVADFTGRRGGVYFEAGFALGLGQQVIWTVRDEESSRLHFDIEHFNFIRWKSGDCAGLKKSLENRIVRTIGVGTYQPQR